MTKLKTIGNKYKCAKCGETFVDGWWTVPMIIAHPDFDTSCCLKCNRKELVGGRPASDGIIKCQKALAINKIVSDIHNGKK